MRPASIKRALVTLFAMSYYMLFTILLVIIEPGTFIKIVLLLIFAFIGYGLECFFTIGSEKRPPAYSTGEFTAFGMFLPSLIYLILGIANFRNVRSELLFTALAAFLTLLLRDFFDMFTGKKRPLRTAERNRRDTAGTEDDNDDNDDKGE